MAKKKYYAVQVGRAPGIYETWEECFEQTNGFSGAKYKSFNTLDEAESFMYADKGEQTVSENKDVLKSLISAEEFNAMVNKKISDLNEDEIVAFVDGSYDSTKEKSAFGAILISYGGNKNKLYKAFTKNLGEDFIELRNVAAELEGVKEAVNWSIACKKRKITIFYDYDGIEKWVTGAWRAKKDLTKRYVSFIQEKEKLIDIEFVKVQAHAGIELNEEVDALAKRALLAQGYKAYNDGSVYFYGYGIKDWITIVDCINEENDNLSKESIAKVSLRIESIRPGKDKITILQSRNKVVITCYANSRSYVQGKQTVLFQKIIATAIELLTKGQTVIETLNNYHALTISKTEVETKFDQLLPNFKKESDKHYSNLLSAVYNTMITGYMPDYTCLVTPVFRAYEFYLHKILGDKMGLDTETDKGTNNFGFFKKNSFGKYECNKNTEILNPYQLDFLNRLYTQYNSVRHPYSHWSASDVDTAVITDCAIARNIILDGLSLVNEYYTLF